MTPYSSNYEEIMSYLLGTLAEEDLQRTEEQLLTDGGFLEELLVCEEELIDDYINDDLPAESRLRFEQHFLCTTERKEKVKFARALCRYTSLAYAPIPDNVYENQSVVVQREESSGGWFKALWGGQTPAFRFAMAVAVVAIVGIGVWLLIPKPKTYFPLALSISSGNRAEGSTSTKVKLPPKVDALKISLVLPELPDSSQNLRVKWDNGQGEVPLTVADQNAKTLTVVIPTEQLTRGQNSLRLYSINSDGSLQRINGDYFFTIE